MDEPWSIEKYKIAGIARMVLTNSVLASWDDDDNIVIKIDRKYSQFTSSISMDTIRKAMEKYHGRKLNITFDRGIKTRKETVRKKK